MAFECPAWRMRFATRSNMSERRLEDSLQDMLEAARRIASFTQGLAFEEFESDLKTQDAVLRNLEVLGEAAKAIPEAYRQTHADLPWTDMARTRDRLFHHYFGVNLDVVWGIVELELPGIIAQLEAIVDQSSA